MAVPRSTYEPTSRGHVLLWLAAAALLGTVLDDEPNVRLAAALLLAPLVVDLSWKARRLGRVRAEVAPRRAIAGAPFRETITLVNPGRAPLRELLVAEPRTRGLPKLVERLPGKGSAPATLDCQSNTRSHLLERVFELTTEWPLGLIRARATIVVPTDFVTEPMRIRLDAQLLRALAERDPAPLPQHPLPGDDFHALREHLPHEEARGVHALRSASLGTLVRTVVRGQAPREVGIVLDLRRPPGRPLLLGQRRFEWSLGAIATLLDRLTAGSTAAQVFVIGSRTVRTTVVGGNRLRDFLTFLAEVAPSPHRPLDDAPWRELQALDHVFWVPAGGYRSSAELRNLQLRVHVLGGDDE